MKLRLLGLALLALASSAGAQQTVTQVRSSPATFPAGTTAPLQSDTHGALHVVSDSTSVVTTTPAVTGNGTAATAQRVTLASDSTGTVTAAGNVASGATDSGNPVKVGGKYTLTRDTLTDGQRGNLSLDSRLNLNVSINAADTGAGLSNNNGVVTQPALSSTFWNYSAATSGIVNTTTAVTIHAAGGAGVRNYLCSIQVAHDALGAATEFVVNDGAAGTALYRGRLQTAAIDSAGGAGTIVFNPCLRGTANTLMEAKTVTAVTGGVFVDAQGYTGSN